MILRMRKTSRVIRLSDLDGKLRNWFCGIAREVTCWLPKRSPDSARDKGPSNVTLP